MHAQILAVHAQILAMHAQILAMHRETLGVHREIVGMHATFGAFLPEVEATDWQSREVVLSEKWGG